ncbi:hypothetical protein JHK82_034038 [Glycine max]|uniref:Glyceraldehyde 3-phosphate dehydrogenase catalytic domain-containing protein n=1 Tax=Glycine max TaxID=3847 RepID=A0A0R0H5R3_SOYBN|nr:hypothetical protein JHK87_033970 [Glycine soja]KAG4980789.1 hypothetical protein JHK85_034747 [Glycine max]KAG4986418.1 hypothetical protein JHK86_034109 [Glycine max]KAG5119618.1 hypothetical protein JHK82_034038 [Glycine max]KAG5140606.1 hypothetical protein JHK84_034374 [Glycine max]
MAFYRQKSNQLRQINIIEPLASNWTRRLLGGRDDSDSEASQRFQRHCREDHWPRTIFGVKEKGVLNVSKLVTIGDNLVAKCPTWSWASKHIQASSKKVIITAPAKGADILMYVVEVNEGDYTHEISSIIKSVTNSRVYTDSGYIFFFLYNVSSTCNSASCTTSCLAPFVKILDEEFASHCDLRRSRAVALNIVLTNTGAAKAMSLVLPQLKFKLNGIALRVPTPNVSVVDLVVNVEKKGLTVEEVNATFKKVAEGRLKGVLDACDVPLVSIDFRCSDVSSTIDSSLTIWSWEMIWLKWLLGMTMNGVIAKEWLIWHI